jgi:TatD DNase family protein
LPTRKSPLMLIDSHVHLFSPDYSKDLDAVIARAHDAGVECFVVPGTTLETSRAAVALAERYPSIYAAVGIHPLDLAGADASALREIEHLSEHKKVIAIGEIGLDYYYDTSPRDVQREMFRLQLEIAVRRNLPVIIHTRDSMSDAVSVLDGVLAENEFWRSEAGTGSNKVPILKGVFHCFSGNHDNARRLAEKGFLVSFPGTVTFKNSGAAEVLSSIGYDHIMLETDGPYLAPVPHRGKRNEPSFLPLIADAVAKTCHATADDVARTTSHNAKKLFGIGAMDPPVFVYQLGRSLYINLTNRCNADCIFCDRKGEAVVKGHNLKITREPTPAEVIAQIGDPTRFEEIVFCGYGEPTIRFDAVKEISSAVKEKGGMVRLNTDGHGSIINKRNIAPELEGLVDTVSVSLNSVDPIQYGHLMRLDGIKYHAAMLDFVREAKKHVPSVVLSVVGMSEVDQVRAKGFAENELGVKYRVRPYF